MSAPDPVFQSKEIITMPSLASFWAGPRISPFEKACLRSFTLRGYHVSLYTYEAVANLPEGVTRVPADELVPATHLNRFLHQNKPDMAHFADYFRYMIFKKTEHVWIDTDIVLLKSFDEIATETILIREGNDNTNNAFMRLDSRHDKLDELIRQAELLMDRELVWGQTGPDLLMKVFGKADPVFRSVHPTEVFFPIHHDIVWKMFLPEFREECQDLCTKAYGVHLFNNIINRMGFWKDLAPPKGSFLATLFEADGTIDDFIAYCPERVTRQIIGNWRSSRSGVDMTFRSVLRQLAPSFRRSTRAKYSFL